MPVGVGPVVAEHGVDHARELVSGGEDGPRVAHQDSPPSSWATLRELADRLRSFESDFAEIGKPFEWTFTRDDLTQLLKKLDSSSLADAASCRSSDSSICYAAASRDSEAVRLTVSAIDSERMVLRVANGKGQKAVLVAIEKANIALVPLSPA